MIAEPCEGQYQLYLVELKDINRECIDNYVTLSRKRVRKYRLSGTENISLIGKYNTFETAKKKANELGLLLLNADSDVIAALPLTNNGDLYQPFKYCYQKKGGDESFVKVGRLSNQKTACSAAEEYAWNRGIPFTRN